MLKKCYLDDEVFEIGVDEVGRGPMFGKVYTAAVVLPKSSDNFNYSLLKDSKKFTSEKKLLEAYDYIINNAIYYSVTNMDEKIIDKINIKNATLQSMHNSIKNIENYKNARLLIDGNSFNPIIIFENDVIKNVDYICIEKGDNKYYSIAAASILAKVERDKYIRELCDKNKFLNEFYDLENNKGYGTKKHIEGIKKYGITEMHRKTFGICRDSKFVDNKIIE